MKKILYLITAMAAMLFVAPIQSEAQRVVGAFVGTASNPTNAVVNTSVDTCYATITNTYTNHAIQLTATKTAGTIAGSAILYGTIDGTTWIATGDTVTLANMEAVSANVKSTKITISNPPWTKYKLVTTGSGTVTMTLTPVVIGLRLF